MATFDPSTLDSTANKRIIQSAVTPRPIAWISTIDDEGIENLAPFSSYNYFSSGSQGSPPVLLFNSPSEERGLKDSAKNALDTGEFAVNVVTEDLVEAMDATSADLPADESEFRYAGIEPAACEKIAPPRVGEAAITMECTLFETVRHYGKLMILGEVVHYHIADDLLEDGKLQMENFVTVGRLGGPYYTAANPMEFQRQY